MNHGRRHLLLSLGATGLMPDIGRTQPAMTPPAPAPTLSRAPLHFPRDHGAHPETRIEWWYVTGLLRPRADAPPAFGFQLTFFRLKHDLSRPLDTPFSPGQLMLGHAAVSDLGRQRLLHDQRILRHGFANARTSEQDTDARLGDWTLKRRDDRGLSRYALTMHSETAGFALQLDLRAPQVPLLQGKDGWSQKGPGDEQASRYVTEPQLTGAGRLALRGNAAQDVQARAWLDHEWSHQYLGRGAEADSTRAVGWDWLGLNLDDGGSLTLFQMRGHDGGIVWTGGSWRGPDGRQQDFQQQLRFEPLAFWTSPVSQARYPVRWRVHTPRGVFRIEAAYDAQEIDGRRSNGFLYWEGVARLTTDTDATDGSPRVLGWGYLELTGYAGRVPL